MIVPFVDLNMQYHSIKSEIDAAIEFCLENSLFVGGEPVAQFEIEFAKYLNIDHCVSCANGTDAIELALQALGIGVGDEVLVPSLSWISTSEAVSNVGGTPVFVDVHSEYYTMDFNEIESKISDRTKAIMPVHLYGLPAEMNEIISLAKKHGLYIIEDCAQAHGAEYSGRKVRGFGDVATFSFYPGKNLGAYGDGGAIVTNNKKISDKVRAMANHGQLNKHNHILEGRNSRLDTLQAAILSVKLKYLDKWTSKRRVNAGHYVDRLKDNNGVIIPKIPNSSKHVFHLFSIQVDKRDLVAKELKRKGVYTGVHYPTALPFLNLNNHSNYVSADFPVANGVTKRQLSLPMYPELSVDQIDYVCDSIIEIISN